MISDHIRTLLRLLKTPYLRERNSRRSESSRAAAIEVVQKHGLEAHLYFPSVGRRDDRELCDALDLLASNGFLVTDSGGNIVGKFMKVNESSSEIADARRAAFKIVK